MTLLGYVLFETLFGMIPLSLMAQKFKVSVNIIDGSGSSVTQLVEH